MAILLVTKCAGDHVSFVTPAVDDERGVFGSDAHFCKVCEDPLVRKDHDEEPRVIVGRDGYGYEAKFLVPGTPVVRKTFAQRVEVNVAIRMFARRVLGPEVGTDALLVKGRRSDDLRAIDQAITDYFHA